MAVKIYTGYFNGVDPETFLDYVSAAAKAPCSLTRYNQAGLQLLPRKSKRYIDGKRTFYHPLAIVEFLTLIKVIFFRKQKKTILHNCRMKTSFSAGLVPTPLDCPVKNLTARM